ncbi:hypothetical protein LCGC14_2815630, partial [marine sediment metagenome]
IEGPIVLRGAVYEEYASGGWKAAPRSEVDVPSALAALDSLSQGGSGRIVPISVTVEAKNVVGTVLFTPGQPLSAGVPAQAKLARGSVRELNVILPSDGGTSLTDDEVLALTPPGWTALYVRRAGDDRVEGVAAVRSLAGLPDVLVLSPRERLQKGESYTVLGFVRDIPPDELRTASTFYPDLISSTYLQLPDMPERVSQLARDVAGAEPAPYDRAKAVESYLRRYSVDYAIPDTPPGRDTVDYFLFEAKRGYFDYHASAMVVMLRSIGVPSRLAVGFVIDEQDFDRDSGSYVVQSRDAYAWVEVYFPGHGWVEFNPSPDRPAELRPGERGDEIGVPPVSLEDIRDLWLPSGGLFPEGLDGLSGGGTGSSSGGSGSGYMLWIALALPAFLAAVAGSAALGWRRSVA